MNRDIIIPIAVAVMLVLAALAAALFVLTRDERK
jgi:flagellar basal body-associated protein FliL